MKSRMNPDMDKNQVFTFDTTLLESIERNHGAFNSAYTKDTELKFYNPRGCNR